MERVVGEGRRWSCGQLTTQRRDRDADRQATPYGVEATMRVRAGQQVGG